MKVVALRKDAETDLADLAEEEAEYRRRVDEAQKSVDSSDYHRVQNLEIELSNLAKWLDKVAFDQRSCTARLEETSAREQKGREFIENSKLPSSGAGRPRAPRPPTFKTISPSLSAAGKTHLPASRFPARSLCRR